MKNVNELKERIADLEQYIFSVKADVELERTQQAQDDLEFLIKLQEQLKRWDERNDWSSRDYAFKMVEDWIDELKVILNKVPAK